MVPGPGHCVAPRSVSPNLFGWNLETGWKDPGEQVNFGNNLLHYDDSRDLNKVNKVAPSITLREQVAHWEAPTLPGARHVPQ